MMTVEARSASQDPANGRQRRPRDSAQLAVQRLSHHDEAVQLGPEWRALYEASAARNPYASPDWISPWLEHLVHEDELALLTVRRDGRLVGVAPCYIRTVGHLLRTVQLAGTVRLPGLTEVPQVLTALGETRSVLRAVVSHWIRHAAQWDWLELPLEAAQGWFEPQWLGESRTFQGFVQHKTTRAAVVLPLPDDASALPGMLKRNVWESVKRARNRLDRTGLPWSITIHSTAPELAVALPNLRRLHAARAGRPGQHAHPDVLAAPESYAFVACAVARMAANGGAELLTLDVEGETVAAQLVLRAPAAGVFALSGVDPAWWHTGPVTLLQFTAIERAVRRGDTEMNLSVGPDISKLRWSEHVVQHPEFVVCGSRARSRRLLTVYSAVASVAAVGREANRQLVSDRGGRGSPI